AALSQVLACDDKIDISDCTQLVFIACGAVVDDFEFELRMSFLITLAPRLEVSRKFVVCDHVDSVQITNTNKVIDDPFHNRFATNHQQRLRFLESQWVKTRCISGSEDQSVHKIKTNPSKTQTGFLLTAI